MSCHTRLQKAFKGAPRLPLNDCSKYVLFSDCHRGVGNSNDNFMQNQPVYLAALQHYFRNDFTYIELGDGDELWENRDIALIIEAHNSVFQMLTHFHQENRLYMLYGNHDIVKKDYRYTEKHCSVYPCYCGNSPHLEQQSLFPHLKIHEGIILENISAKNVPNLYLTHGHQADLLNSTLWPLSRFLVRYLWKPLEHYGVLDPTSAAKNYTKKRQTESCLLSYAKEKGILLIAGHTHRPRLVPEDLSYCNSGSCIHPYSITCLELENMYISLVKWSLTAGEDMRMYVNREVLKGPVRLEN